MSFSANHPQPPAGRCRTPLKAHHETSPAAALEVIYARHKIKAKPQIIRPVHHPHEAARRKRLDITRPIYMPHSESPLSYMSSVDDKVAPAKKVHSGTSLWVFPFGFFTFEVSQRSLVAFRSTLNTVKKNGEQQKKGVLSTRRKAASRV